MKVPLFAILALCLAAPSPTLALTVEEDVTPEYVRAHAKELSVKVTEGKNGLLAFTVVLTLKEPRYVVAHLAVRDGGRTLAESDTPAFTRNAQNTFYFSIAPEYIATSGFSLGISGFANAEGEAVPVVGTTDYRFHLSEFVPVDLRRPSVPK